MSSDSFEKRAREKKLRERAAAKRERRAEKAERADSESPDIDALMERFRLLSEEFASGAMDRDTYETERESIFQALGLGSGSGDAS